MSRKPAKNEAQLLIQALSDCAVGRESAAEFEKLCCNILHYLFPTEFFSFNEQCSTYDEMYRMDLQVSLNGKTKFWRFLINNYQSRYVVFEFKNYAEPLKPDVIDLTKKYYCKTVMRNVIFLISRKGFSKHARTASRKCIHDGQLMIELTDADLIEMLRMKQAHQDPSLHLQRKVDALLMGFSA